MVSCTAPIAEPSPQEAQSIEPARIEAHYGRLNSAETGGRRTATIGYAAAATYVAERLAGFGIQPIHPGEYRHLSYGPINHVRGMTLRVLDADSTTWGNDAFMLPDPRTSSGRLVLRSFRKLASGQPIPPGLPGTVAVTDFVPSDSLAVAVAAAGYPALIMLGSPRPGRSDRALPLGMVQMARERWLRISGPNTSALEGALNVRISIEAAFDPAAGYVHVMGIIPGSHPVERNRLVVLGANLDSGADPSGPTLLDPEASGIAAAGLLEAARVLALEEDQGRGQPHSILVAWWAGGAQGNAGLRGFLENPPWSERAIDQVYYAGRPFAGGRARIERLGADAVLASPAADPVRERGTELAAAYYQKARAAGG